MLLIKLLIGAASNSKTSKHFKQMLAFPTKAWLKHRTSLGVERTACEGPRSVRGRENGLGVWQVKLGL